MQAEPGGRRPRYSLSRIEHHHHTVCIRCGNVGEFRAATVERLMHAIGDDIPGEIVGHRIELYVVCRAVHCGRGRLEDTMDHRSSRLPIVMILNLSS